MKKSFRSLITTLLLMSLSKCCNCQGYLIEGALERCDEEGKVMNIPLVSDNPCFTCMCKKGSIQCSREECPSHYPCMFTIDRGGKCCRECLGCKYEGRNYDYDEKWEESGLHGQCVKHICKNGVVMKEHAQCHGTCDRPQPLLRGPCGCPACPGCTHNNTTVSEGEIFSPAVCVECTCLNGHTECWKKVCPVLVCEDHQQRLDDDGCCMTCTGQRLMYELKNGGCWFKRGFLENDEAIRIDACTTCVCKNGTIICSREVCRALLPCQEEDVIQDGCCPRCADKVFLNCSDSGGNFVEHGETWRDSRDVCLLCSCWNGEIMCERETCLESKSCPQGEVKDKHPGQCCPTCQPEPGICSVFGDPHYRSFDGKAFNFQGDCRYLLSRDCLGKNFSIIVDNNAKMSPTFSWTNSVHLRLFHQDSGHDLMVSLFQRLVVKVNGQRVPLPYVGLNILIWVENHVVKVRTNAGISLNWDGDSFLEVGASSAYRGTLCGLCGNFNGFARDDFIGKDGNFKFDKEKFAQSWKTGTRSKHCSRKRFETRSIEPCVGDLNLKLKARKACQVFKSKMFRKCYSQVDPVDYYRSCLTDMCECPHTRKCSCESIRAYTAACFRKNIKIDWDEAAHCKRPCTHGKVYSSCGSPCKAKCKNIFRLKRKTPCRRSCVAGCFCPAGYATRGRKCVKISKCYLSSNSRKRKTKSRPTNPLQRFLKT